MLGQIRHELGHVGAGFHVLGHPAEARRRIAGAYRPHNVGQIRGVHGSQHPFGHFHGHRAVAEGDELLQRGERVAHATLGPVRDEFERLPLELHVLSGANGTQPRHHGLGGDAAEIEALAPRVNGLGHLLRVGGGQDEHHVARRFLQRLQKRVEGGRREHVHLVDDVYLVAPARRRELHAPDDLLADVLHAGAARGIQLVDVRVLAGGDHLAILAGAVGLGGRPLLAQKRLGQKARRGGLAGAARAREQVGVAHLVLGDGVFDGALDVLLTDHVLEDLRSVLAIECLGHGLLPAFLLSLGSRLRVLGRHPAPRLRLRLGLGAHHALLGQLALVLGLVHALGRLGNRIALLGATAR